MSKEIIFKAVLDDGEFKAKLSEIEQASQGADSGIRTFEQGAKSLGQQLKTGAGISEFNKAADEVNKTLNQQTKNVKQTSTNISAYGKAVDDTAKKQQSLTSRARQLRNELVALELAGKRDTEQFRQLSNEAARLNDAIGDVSKRTKALASDTASLDAFAQGVQGIAGGFAAAQGFAALFGKENEDVQKALLKVQATLAIVNGLQAVFNTLNKDSAFLTVANAKATGIASGAYRALGIQVNTASIAFKALRAAIIATGIGAIVAIIGTLASKFESLNKEAKQATGSVGELENQLVSLADKSRQLQAQALQSTVKLLVAQNKLSQLAADELLVRRDLKGAIDEVNQTAVAAKRKEIAITDEAIKQIENEISLLQEQKEQFRQTQSARQQGFVQGNQAQSKQLLKQEENLRKQIEQIRAQSADRISEIDAETEKQRQLLTFISENTIQEGKIKAAKDGAKKLEKIEKERVEAISRITLEEFAKAQALLDAQREARNLGAEAQRARGEELIAEIEAIQKNGEIINREILRVQNNLAQARSAAIKAELKEQQQLRILAGEDEVKVKTETDLLIQKIDAETKAQLRKNEQELNDFILQQRQQLVDQTIQVFGSIFQLQSAALRREIDDLSKAREQELTNFKGTEQERARLIRQFEARERAAKQRAAQAERDRALFEVAINTLVQASKQLGNPALVALILAQGALQAAAIKAQPLPQFSEGGVVGGKLHRQGGTVIEAERGEFITNRHASRKHRDLLEAVNTSDAKLNDLIFKKFVLPEILGLNKQQSIMVNASLKSDRIESELRKSRKQEINNTKLLAELLSKSNSQNIRSRW